jgi:hypothetical protein
MNCLIHVNSIVDDYFGTTAMFACLSLMDDRPTFDEFGPAKAVPAYDQ